MDYSIDFTITPKRIMNLVSTALGHQISTSDAEAFMQLFHDDLEDKLMNTLRTYVVGKLS